MMLSDSTTDLERAFALCEKLELKIDHIKTLHSLMSCNVNFLLCQQQCVEAEKKHALSSCLCVSA